MRRLPHQGARHSTVDHGDASDSVFLRFSSTCGCFLRVEWTSLRTISLLFSLACGWPLRRMALCLANGGASSNIGLNDLRVQEKVGRTDACSGPGWPAWADRPKPISSRFGHPFAPVGPHVFALCPLYLHHFDDVILASRSFTLQSSGMFLCNTSVLATFGSDFIKLLNTNKTPKLILWTCYDSVLYVHIFLHEHNTSKCTHNMNLLYD
jgi:hypothetical protein